MATVISPILVVVAAVGFTAAVALVVLVTRETRTALREADTADTQPLSDLFALAASMHTPTCDCWRCYVDLLEAARAIHEADQLEAQFEQTET